LPPSDEDSLHHNKTTKYQAKNKQLILPTANQPAAHLPSQTHSPPPTADQQSPVLLLPNWGKYHALK